ncbi:DUR3 [Mytilus coruscus]|uniref:DUR3 n=1 Tax=Mytilus coruscus TaxID=42192 RepID=A0A6J8EL60_MYTCO|nr:DUR3 [Mytilus coruscus]
MLWPSDFLQSATIMSKTGLGGSLFYAISIVFDILMFPVLSLTLKTRAPGAKTFLQIIYARFGKGAHIGFCCIALFTNLITVMALILAAKAAIYVLVKDVSDEMILLLLAFLFGSYCFIGGLGTTFYISYFNTALTFVSVLVFIVHVTYKETDNIFVMKENMYEAMKCVHGPDGNYQNSFMTFRSQGGLILGVVTFLMSTSVSFLDQANWQSRIASKPFQGVAGFFIAAYLWFAIPLTITITSTTVYMSMSYQNGTHLLSPLDIDSGYITPYVMEAVMGKTGAYMLITMVTMALMSTGSGEVMAVSSIIVYDIYKVYINPYRKGIYITQCPLCGKEKTHTDNTANSDQICKCPSVFTCKACENDVVVRLKAEQFIHPYECSVHGRYRRYEDELSHYKSWCMLWVTIAIVPYGLLIINSGVNLNWVFFTLPGVLNAFPFPLLMTIVWSKCTAKAVITGSIMGVFAYVAGVLIVAELVYEGGLGNFLTNTFSDYSLLGGLTSAVIISVSSTIIISLCTHNIKTKHDAERVWDKTLSIDNPLNPWRCIYGEELANINVSEDIKVNTTHMTKIFRSARILAVVGGLISFVIFGVVIPANVLSLEILTLDQFSSWTFACQIWVMIAAAFAIVVPPVEEIVQIVRFYIRNKPNEFLNKEEYTLSGSKQSLVI